MRYSELVDVYEKLENTSSRLKKVDIIAALLKKSKEELSNVTLLLQGMVYPSYDEREVGLAAQSMEKIIARATGFSIKDVGECFRNSGDYGLIAEELIGKKKQQTLMSRPLTLNKVFENLQKLASIEGKGSQDIKFRLVAELITSAKPKEAKYIIRAAIGDLRIGVAEGMIRDAIAQAFLKYESMEEKKKAQSMVEWAWFLRPHYGEVAVIAREKGATGLSNVGLSLGKPYHVCLAEKSTGLKEAMEKFENPGQEFKYDGARIIIHKKGQKLWFFTRRLENITKQFPELHDYVNRAVTAKECIIEGEMLGFDKKSMKPMPFQFLSQRIKRKYDIDRIVKEIPIQVNLFDITYLEGNQLFDKPLKERWQLLKKIIKPIDGKLQLAKHIETKDLEKVEEFYQKALNASQEGIIIKNMDATYQPGRRVGYWLKVKPVMETLDLAIIGAVWGTGKRAGFLGSLILGCKDGDEFKNCGMMGSGLKEKEESVEASGGVTLDTLTRLLKPLITSESGNEVKIKPDVVVEVAYEEIQQSPNYESGYALRFPRIIRLRTDVSVKDVDSKARIENLYAMQKGNRRGKNGI